MITYKNNIIYILRSFLYILKYTHKIKDNIKICIYNMFLRYVLLPYI